MKDPHKSSSAYQSQRRFHRARIPLLVQYRFSPSEPYTTDYSADLSRGGMFIRTNEPYPIGTVMDLQFVSRDGQRVIQGRGRIVRVIKNDAESGQAIEFIGFSGDDADYLSQLVKQQQGKDEQGKLRIGRKSSRSTLKASKVSAEQQALPGSDK